MTPCTGWSTRQGRRAVRGRVGAVRGRDGGCKGQNLETPVVGVLPTRSTSLLSPSSPSMPARAGGVWGTFTASGPAPGGSSSAFSQPMFGLWLQHGHKRQRGEGAGAGPAASPCAGASRGAATGNQGWGPGQPHGEGALGLPQPVAAQSVSHCSHCSHSPGRALLTSSAALS